MTLHEAIRQVLLEKNSMMSTVEIADELNKRDLYRKRDGSEITDFQIHGRTKNYPHIFTRKGSMVGLTEGVSDFREEVNSEQNAKENNTQNSVDEFELSKSVTKSENLIEMGFTNIGTIESLFSNGLPKLDILKKCGIYAIIIPESYQLEFISLEEVIKNNNVIEPLPIEHLEEKWVSNVEIVYYGLAGKKSSRSLISRLDDLLRHGQGKTTDRGPHKGGEILWQLEGYESFRIWIRSTSDPPIPRRCEKKLLVSFYSETGKLPFANRRF